MKTLRVDYGAWWRSVQFGGLTPLGLCVRFLALLCMYGFRPRSYLTFHMLLQFPVYMGSPPINNHKDMLYCMRFWHPVHHVLIPVLPGKGWHPLWADSGNLPVWRGVYSREGSLLLLIHAIQKGNASESEIKAVSDRMFGSVCITWYKQ